MLFYGLFQQLGTSLLFGFFLIFQYFWLHSLYGVEFGVVIALLAGYGITVFCAQLTAMAVYSFTNMDEGRQRIAKAVFYGLFFAYAAGLLFYMLGDQAQALPRLVEAMNGTAFRLFPVVGWTADITNGVIAADLPQTVLGAVISAGYVAGVAILIAAAKPDYYEDVISSTERGENELAARRSGRIGEASFKKVKTGKTGIGQGEGASAFYYKHLVENRRARVLLLNPQMLIFALVIIALSYFLKDRGLATVFILATYLLILSVVFGRFQKELLKPYVYLVPEPPFKKLMACLREGFAGYVAEAVIVFIPVGFILGLSPLVTLLCVAARISFAYLFVAANIVVGRVFGTLTSRVFTMLAYFAAVVVLCLPGIIAASFLLQANILLFDADATMLIGITAFNIPVVLLTLFLCRNMLKYTELNN